MNVSGDDRRCRRTCVQRIGTECVFFYCWFFYYFPNNKEMTRQTKANFLITRVCIQTLWTKVFKFSERQTKPGMLLTSSSSSFIKLNCTRNGQNLSFYLSFLCEQQSSNKLLEKNELSGTQPYVIHNDYTKCGPLKQKDS